MPELTLGLEVKKRYIRSGVRLVLHKILTPKHGPFKRSKTRRVFNVVKNESLGFLKVGFLMVELGQQWTGVGWYYSIAAPELTARINQDPTALIKPSHNRKMEPLRALWSSYRASAVQASERACAVRKVVVRARGRNFPC